MNYNKDSLLRIPKSAIHVLYSDYIVYYKELYNYLKAEPKDANGILLKMFENLPDKERVLISKINDVATVISKLKGPILSQILYENERGVECNVRRFLVDFLIEAAITNCGLPYIPPKDGNKITDSSENDK